MPNSIFFPQKGIKNSQFAVDCQSENLSTKIECAIHNFQNTRSEKG